MWSLGRLLGIMTLSTLLVASHVLSDTSECLATVSEYLVGIGLSTIEFESSQQQKIQTGEMLSEQMRMALRQAQNYLEHPVVARTGASSKSIFRPLEPSTRCSRLDLSTTIRDLRKSYDDCDQVSLDYIMIVADYNIYRGESALINRLARSRAELCWLHFASGVSRQLDRVMGKMTEPVFRNLEQIAETMDEFKKTPARKAATYEMDTIHIDEEKARTRAAAEAKVMAMGNDRTHFDLMGEEPEAFLAILETFKGIDFSANHKIREFARAIYKLFKEQQAVVSGDKHKKSRDFLSSFFIEPCQQLVDRVRSIVSLGEIYRRSIKHTLGNLLAAEKCSNPRLCYELEVYRICKYGLAEEDTITRFMEKAY